MTNPWKTAIITAIVVTICGGFLVTLLIGFLSIPSPILYLHDNSMSINHCLTNGFQENGEYTLYLSNRAETPAYSKVCFFGENVIFNNEGKNYSNTLCYPENEIVPKSAEFNSIYYPRINLNNSNKEANFSISVTITCKYNILSIIPRSCNGFNVQCNYRKNGQYYYFLS